MKQFLKSISFAWLLVLPTLGVAAEGNVPTGIAAPQPAASGPASVAPAAGHPAPEGKGDGAVSGKIVETMNSGGYTYINLESNGTKTWVAVPETPVKVGQEVSCASGTEMGNFTSKTLKRSFDRIVFCNTQLDKKGGDTGIGDKSPGSKGAIVGSAETVKVEKAAGANAYTVGDIYKNKAKLDRKKVVVRGKVVKVSGGIMGKNWIHLQDGSGSRKKGTHNLVITSQELPGVGDVVTMQGTLYKDKDFGSGYKYDVIMEEATIQK
ncbi:DNA-binding protein [Geobacter sp. AOG1]|uniref:DNA-binding protein n=1 Tax=Geobacter sp. AOG1 TaxID=1566346 RepID=UPI001CC3E356|nr:DNA-binding protein [Geobacter sp. AOG1]GFE57241.1 hypothetical protein AOG1_11210 [Geobacter sp. AOG1]